MNVLIWLAEGTWEATVDAARDLAPPDAAVTLLHVTDADLAAGWREATAGLLGRGHRPGSDAPLAEAERALLDEAAARLGRPAEVATRAGRIEREVVAACAGADLLILARDGDRERIGPRSLGPHTRFVVDHAPCPVLLVWPGARPPVELPPPPPHHPPPPPPPPR